MTMLPDPYTSQVLSFLVHAVSKVGKTTLAATSPKPLLLLDAEGGSKFLPHTKVVWEPRMGPPPNADGTWDICIVHVRTYDDLQTAYSWLAAGQHQFRSLCIDSITEAQRRCKEHLRGTESMRIQDWGDLLTKMEVLVRRYRDLTLHPTNPLSVAMFIAETEEHGGKYRPSMQGRMASSLPYLMDVIGYLYVAEVADPVDPAAARKQRQLLVSSHPQFEAGERVQGRLPDVVVEPNVEQMLIDVYATDTQPAR